MAVIDVFSGDLDKVVMVKQGDSNNIMKQLPDDSIDLFITDPPYKDYQSNRTTIKQTKISANDFSPEVLISHIERVLKPTCHFYIFCDHMSFPDFFRAIEKSSSLRYKNMIVWVKNNHGSGDLSGNYAPQHELIIYGVKNKGKALNFRPSNVLYKNVNGNIEFYKKIPSEVYNHPTIKPTEILEILIKASSNKNDLVLDPYAGSFSTAHACVSTERRSLSIELDKVHYKNGKTRLRNIQ